MRVIHVDTGREWRGGQSQVLMLARGMLDRGHDTVIAARKRSPLARRAESEGVPCTEMPFRFEADPSSAMELARIAGARQAVFHAHTPHALGLSILARVVGKPHTILFTRRVSFPVKKFFINRWKLNQADRIIAVSETVADQLRTGGIAPERICVIHSAIDTRAFRYHGPNLERPLNVLVLGAIEEAKGIGEAMTFAEQAADLDLRFHFAGTGPDIPRLQKWAAGRKDAVVHGFVADIPGLMQRMFAAVTFSPSEGFPNMVLQSMAAGLPILAFENDAVKEILVNEGLGCRFVSRDDALATLKNWASDPDEAIHTGQRASEYVSSRYSHDVMVERTLSVYKEIVA